MTKDQKTSVRTTVCVVVVLSLAIAAIDPFGWSYGNSKEAAKRTACLSNMKRLSSATLLYAGDHDEALPVVVVEGIPTVVGWAARIRKYLPQETSSSPERGWFFSDPGDRANTPEERRLGYAMNANAASLPLTTSATEPSRSVLLFEASGGSLRENLSASTLAHSPSGDGAIGGFLGSYDHGGPPQIQVATGSLANSGLPEDLAPRHDDKANFAMVDSSARRRLPAEVSAGASAASSRNQASRSGCHRSDLPGIDRPCAQGTGLVTGGITFSLR